MSWRASLPSPTRKRMTGFPPSPPGARPPRPLAPREAQPVQPVEDVALVLHRRAGDVRVLQAEDERAADVAREEVVEQRRACRPDVERPRRARRDAAADGHAALVREVSGPRRSGSGA